MNILEHSLVLRALKVTVRVCAESFPMVEFAHVHGILRQFERGAQHQDTIGEFKQSDVHAVIRWVDHLHLVEQKK